MSRMRPLKLDSLWIVPAIYFARCRRYARRSSRRRLGWDRLHRRICDRCGGWLAPRQADPHRRDPETGELQPAGFSVGDVFLLALIVVESWCPARFARAPSGVSPAMLTDPFIGFALGMFSADAGRAVPSRQAAARGSAAAPDGGRAALLRSCRATERAPLGAGGIAQSRIYRRGAARMAAGTRARARSCERHGRARGLFRRALSQLEWQPSDAHPDALASIAAWRDASGLANVRPPVELDASAPEWPIEALMRVVNINMVHISPWSAALGLLDGAARVLTDGRWPLILYGPGSRTISRPRRAISPSIATSNRAIRTGDFAASRTLPRPRRSADSGSNRPARCRPTI